MKKPLFGVAFPFLKIAKFLAIGLLIHGLSDDTYSLEITFIRGETMTDLIQELSAKQIEIMSEFYSRPLVRVALVKAERDRIWNQFKKSRTYPLTFHLEKHAPALQAELDKSISSGNLVQAAVFSECVYSQALANILGLSEFSNYSLDDTWLSSVVKDRLKELGFAPRYIYRNSEQDRFLIQAGGFGGVDAALISVLGDKVFTIEYKEPGAKTSEPDLPKYGEDGFIISDESFEVKNPQYKKMLDEQIAKKLNIFVRAGSNINDFSPESIEFAVHHSYGTVKKADVICVEDADGLLTMIPSHHAKKWAELEGEIRPGGRNAYKVWTPGKAKSLIADLEGTIEGDNVRIPKKNLKIAKARGGNKDSRFKLNPIFFVRIENCVVDGDIVEFDLSDLRQIKATIAGKMFFKTLKAESVRDYYKTQV